MKKIYTLGIKNLITSISYGQAPTCEYAKQIGGTGFEWGKSIAIDNFGNVYTTGSFSDTVDFDPGSGTANLISIGSV